MYIIIGIMILLTFIKVHQFLKDLRRKQLQDKLLEDNQALAEYARWKMEQEIKENNEE